MCGWLGVHRAKVALNAIHHINGGQNGTLIEGEDNNNFAAERLLAPFVLSQLWRGYQSLPLQRHRGGSTVSEGHFWHDDREKGET